MILVLNKKNGVGSSLISYNLSRLYSLPLFTTETNFMRSKEHKEKFPTVKNIPKSYKKGIYDVGSHNLTKTLTHKILLNTKLLIVPFELGYESTIKAIETVKYIQSRKPNIKVLLILNRLDKHDDERDFNYTHEAKVMLNNNGIILGHATEHDNDNNIHLTYLRNSYSLFSHVEEGDFFLDKMYKENLVFDKLKNKMPISFDYWYFMYLASSFVCSDKYLDDTVYNQTKDIVTFRTDYERFISVKSRVYLNNLSKKEKKEYESFCITTYRNYYYQDIDKNTLGRILYFKIHNLFLENYIEIEFGINREEGYKKSLFSLVDRKEYEESRKLELKPNILETLTDNTYFKNKEPKLLKDLAFITYAIDNLLMMAGPFKNLCQSGKITNTQGKTDEYRNRCRAICS